MNIRDEVKVINDEIIKWRRDFHEYPELGFQEKRTSQTIYELLQSFGLSPILDLSEEEAGKIIMDAGADWFN